MTDEELSISDATLIARLRLLNEVDANVAADRIKALLQAVRHANDHADVAIADMQSAEDRIRAFEEDAGQQRARAERLEAALREIAKPYPADQDRLIHSQQQIASITRTALKGDNHE